MPVETRVIPLSQLRVAPPKKMAISSIEASLRLDAVASAGMNAHQQLPPKATHQPASMLLLWTRLAASPAACQRQGGSLLAFKAPQAPSQVLGNV